ncbi:hypothetical protein ILYODFUR_021219 [Ilyodon furcidens]|uniref:Uncharacterized protein n=1 Tax=Ilyodon furcidens TaxID=33524 RepID=A0ABV0SPB4_9TELE
MLMWRILGNSQTLVLNSPHTAGKEILWSHPPLVNTHGAFLRNSRLFSHLVKSIAQQRSPERCPSPRLITSSALSSLSKRLWRLKELKPLKQTPFSEART